MRRWKHQNQETGAQKHRLGRYCKAAKCKQSLKVDCRERRSSQRTAAGSAADTHSAASLNVKRTQSPGSPAPATPCRREANTEGTRSSGGNRQGGLGSGGETRGGAQILAQAQKRRQCSQGRGQVRRGLLWGPSTRGSPKSIYSARVLYFRGAVAVNLEKQPGQ